MDIYCSHCGEPWDNEELHERAKEIDSDYSTVAQNFREFGCRALGESCTPVSDANEVGVLGERANARAKTASAIYELMGDDMDGAASTMEDAERLGIL